MYKELNEFKNDLSVEELADIIEVIEAVKKLPEYQNVEEVRTKKLEEKGGFEKRLKVKGEK